MNLLVILSALLTALTGIVTGGRPVSAAAQEQVAATAARRSATSVAAVPRPAQPRAAVPRTPGPAAVPYALRAAVAPFFHRRRE